MQSSSLRESRGFFFYSYCAAEMFSSFSVTPIKFKLLLKHKKKGKVNNSRDGQWTRVIGDRKEIFTLISCYCEAPSKMAFTFTFFSIMKVHLLVGSFLQSLPFHPRKTESVFGFAVSDTSEPMRNSCSQLSGQVSIAGSTMTFPCPLFLHEITILSLRGPSKMAFTDFLLSMVTLQG